MEASFIHRVRRAVLAQRDSLLEWWNGAPHREQPTEAEEPPASGEMIAALDQTLEKIEHGTFGHCELCDGEVEPERLALDFTTCVCLDHYTEPQIRALERDLQMAAQVQQHLFPGCVPAIPGVEIAVHARPAQIVSGDYYDFFCYRDYAQGIAIADVMGKGLPASMLMANLQASLRILGPEYAELNALAARLNELFRYNLRRVRFISMFLLAIDVEAGVLRYCNAGHHPPLFWEAAARRPRWLKPTGPAIGIMPDPAFRAESIALRSGDVVVLYTDGLVEARNAEDDEFGEERLARYVDHHHQDSAEDLLTGLWNAAERFTEGGLHDDVTLLVVKVA